ncbi:MAG: hypothetical protein DIU80_018805 [Chloroflexota bacterium]
MTLARPTLFSPLVLGRAQLPNRVAMASRPSGCAVEDGRVTREMAAFYLARARGGAGLIVTEPAFPVPPRARTPHLALYDDAHIAALRTCITAVQAAGATVLVMLDQPLDLEQFSGAEIAELGALFITAAWRAHSAGAAGVMLSTCEDGPFATLLSPLLNRRTDQHAAGLEGRLWLLLNVVEGIIRWLGPSFVVGVRLVAEEFAPGGIELQDARVIARRLTSAGAGLLEVGTRSPASAPVAQFPGWRLPLATAIRAVVDVPVMVGGLMDDPALADSAVRDGSTDLIDVGERLLRDPHWPAQARAALRRASQ